jgi:predicted N-acetyltransferase YhbS
MMRWPLGDHGYYERFGFEIVEEAAGGGPRIWFMRWDP